MSKKTTRDTALSATQQAVLVRAIAHDGAITWFPETVKGNARQKVLEGLATRGLAAGSDAGWNVTEAGYAALNATPPAAAPAFDAELAAMVAAAEAGWTQPASESTPPLEDEPAPPESVPQTADTTVDTNAAPTPPQSTPRTRDNSKQALVIQMLKRPEGATVRQICEATGWQSHTVRGTFAGAFKKKLGLTLSSEKAAGGERVYRIA